MALTFFPVQLPKRTDREATSSIRGALPFCDAVYESGCSVPSYFEPASLTSSSATKTIVANYLEPMTLNPVCAIPDAMKASSVMSTHKSCASERVSPTSSQLHAITNADVKYYYDEKGAQVLNEFTAVDSCSTQYRGAGTFSSKQNFDGMQHATAFPTLYITDTMAEDRNPTYVTTHYKTTNEIEAAKRASLVTYEVLPSGSVALSTVGGPLEDAYDSRVQQEAEHKMYTLGSCILLLFLFYTAYVSRKSVLDSMLYLQFCLSKPLPIFGLFIMCPIYERRLQQVEKKTDSEEYEVELAGRLQSSEAVADRVIDSIYDSVAISCESDDAATVMDLPTPSLYDFEVPRTSQEPWLDVKSPSAESPVVDELVESYADAEPPYDVFVTGAAAGQDMSKRFGALEYDSCSIDAPYDSFGELQSSREC